MNNVEKQARKDAEEFAKAYMSYGEGAGTRRKLINGTVDFKKQTVPGYAAAFEKNAQKQNMADHAKKAQKEARRKDVTQTVSRNARAIATGRHENMTTGVMIVGAIAIAMHQTGMDKAIFEAGKRKYRDVKNRVKSRFHKKDEPIIYNITDI